MFLFFHDDMQKIMYYMGKVKLHSNMQPKKNVITIQNWVRRGFYRTIKYLVSYKYELQVTSTSYKLQVRVY
jgi:hypothetical protein